MAKPDTLTAADGLPARTSGVWARDKHEYLRRYLGTFTTAMRGKWGRLGYIDLMAGPGRCKVLESGEEFDGSPVVALKTDPPFDWSVFLESDSKLAAALQARVSPWKSRAHVTVGSCSDQEALQKVTSRMNAQSLTVAFIDNLGMNAPFASLKSMAARGPVDFIVTFPLLDLFRNGRNVLEGGDNPDRWTAFFGTDRWAHVAGDHFRRGKTDDGRKALIKLYADQLAAIGHTKFEQSPTMRTTTGAPLYRLVLFSRSPLAAKFFRETSRWYEADGQKPLDFG